jgi:hypothetical protein
MPVVVQVVGCSGFSRMGLLRPVDRTWRVALPRFNTPVPAGMPPTAIKRH